MAEVGNSEVGMEVSGGGGAQFPISNAAIQNSAEAAPKRPGRGPADFFPPCVMNGWRPSFGQARQARDLNRRAWLDGVMWYPLWEN